MITLYQFATSPFCEKIRRILGYKQIAYRIETVDRTRADDYVDVSPIARFPAIEHAGRAVSDSTEIAHYLETQFPERPLIPTDPKAAAQVHILEDWADESLFFYEVVMRLSWEHNAREIAPTFAATMPHVPPDRVVELMTTVSSQRASEQGLGRKSPAAVVEDVRRHMESISTLTLDGGWLVGDSLTLADIAVAAQVNAMLDAREAREIVMGLPAVADWLERVNTLAPDGSRQP